MTTFTFTRNRTALLAVVAGLIALLAGQALGQSGQVGQRGAASGSGSVQGSVQGLVQQLGAGIEIDFEPLTSPGNALAVGDVAVLGRLAEVGEGVSLDFGDELLNQRAAGGYVTLAMKVDDVVGGDKGLLRDEVVFIQLTASSHVDLDALRESNANPRMVVVLDELSDWRPGTARIVRPKALADATLFAPYFDGLWFEGEQGQMVGLHTTPEELGKAWEQPQTIDEFAERLRQAVPDRIEPTQEPKPDGDQLPRGETNPADPRPVPPEVDDQKR